MHQRGSSATNQNNSKIKVKKKKKEKNIYSFRQFSEIFFKYYPSIRSEEINHDFNIITHVRKKLKFWNKKKCGMNET